MVDPSHGVIAMTTRRDTFRPGQWLWRGWKTFWFARLDPLPLAVFRIAVGSLMFWAFVCLYPDWSRYFGSSGVQSLNDPTLPAPFIDWWSIFYWTETFLPVRAIWWLALMAAVGFTIGWQTRACAILLFIIESSMIHSNRWAINGEDLIFRMLMLYACFATLHHRLSVDRWLETRRGGSPAIAPAAWPVAWPVRLMQINIALVYAISLPNKLVDDVAWRDGNAIYLSIVSNMWSRFPWPALFYDGLLSKFFTYGTIVVEGLFPILVWFRRTRLYITFALASLHLGIAIMLQNVAFFSLAMVCSFTVFLPADFLRRVALFGQTTLAPRLAPGRRAAAAITAENSRAPTPASGAVPIAPDKP